MLGRLVTITAKHMNFQDNIVAVETNHEITHEELDKVTVLSTRRIHRDATVDAATRPEDLGLVPVGRFIAMGGFLKRSPEGTLSVMLPFNDDFLRSELGDLLWFSTEPL